MYDNPLLKEKRDAQKRLDEESEHDWNKYIELTHKIAKESEERYCDKQTVSSVKGSV